MADIEDRSDDYDRKVAAAGGTENVVKGLVQTVERSRRTLRLLIISLIFDIILSLGFGLLAIVALRNSDTIERQAKIACIASAKTSLVVNNFLYQQIENTKTSTQRSEEEKKETIAIYKDLIVEVPNCKGSK